MPTYDYVCDACGHTFEEFQAMSEDPLTKCPQCKKLKLQRLLGTGAAILLKGSGFYQTDYRSESYKKAAKADEAATNGTAGKGACAGSPDGACTGACAAGKTEAKSPKSKG